MVRGDRPQPLEELRPSPLLSASLPNGTKGSSERERIFCPPLPALPPSHSEDEAGKRQRWDVERKTLWFTRSPSPTAEVTFSLNRGLTFLLKFDNPPPTRAL